MGGSFRTPEIRIAAYGLSGKVPPISVPPVAVQAGAIRGDQDMNGVTKTCPLCGGHGTARGRGYCPACRGRGVVVDYSPGGDSR